MMINAPLCDDCGERATMMLSVANLVGRRLLFEEVLDELCPLCAATLDQMIQFD